MQPTIPVGSGVAILSFRLGSDPEPQLCTLGVQAIAGPLGVEHANRVQDAWQQTIMGQQSNAVAFLGCTIRVRQDDGSDSVETGTPPINVQGGAVASSLPSNTSFLVEKLTALGGRRGVGRMFVPGPTENNVDEAGVFSAAYVSAFNPIAQSFFTKLLLPDNDATVVGAPVQPVLYHTNTTDTVRQTVGNVTTVTTTVGAAGGPPTPITGFRLDPKVATQRRRLR